ncbi:NADH dehydrogenase 1, alpha/beta subcomplex subunit 1 ndufab1/ACP [Rhizophlyctis rosea]|nr:NADH dehydrogenase 1, alpha/beta subcomplex subunit 1 ndufab1/ACP [Rhizophlyctis rosea]
MSRMTILRTVARSVAARSPLIASRVATPLVTLPRSAVARLPSISAFPSRSYAGRAPLTPQQIEDRILQLLKDFEKVDPVKLTIDSHFINDLGLDSLDQVEITMALEDEFSIEIPDRDAEEIFTARQAVEKVYANRAAI